MRDARAEERAQGEHRSLHGAHLRRTAILICLYFVAVLVGEWKHAPRTLQLVLRLVRARASGQPAENPSGMDRRVDSGHWSSVYFQCAKSSLERHRPKLWKSITFTFDY